MAKRQVLDAERIARNKGIANVKAALYPISDDGQMARSIARFERAMEMVRASGIGEFRDYERQFALRTLRAIEIFRICNHPFQAFKLGIRAHQWQVMRDVIHAKNRIAKVVQGNKSARRAASRAAWRAAKHGPIKAEYLRLSQSGLRVVEIYNRLHQQTGKSERQLRRIITKKN